MSRLPDQEVTERVPVVKDDSFTVLSNLLPTADICKEDTDRRIFGGRKAQEDEYPWTVLLQYNKRKKSSNRTPCSTELLTFLS